MKKILTLIIGIALIVFGVCVIKSGNELVKRCSEEATATVIRIVKEENIDSEGVSEYLYYPVLEFKAGDRLMTVQGTNGANPAENEVNDKIDIKYNPEDPNEFLIKGDKGYSMAGIIWIVFGVIAILIAIKQLIFGR